MKLKNIGRVKVTFDLIYDNPQNFMDIFMSKVIVLRAEVYPNEVVDYIIYNKDLKEVLEGEEIPCYMALVEDSKLLFKKL